MNKKFDKDLYDKNDARGKEVITEYLESKGFQVEEHPNGKFGVDLKGAISGSVFYFDSEVLNCWKSGSSFPFRTAHVPSRKGKFADKKNTWFVSVCNDLRSMLFVNRKELIDSRLIEVKNKYMADGEYFYNIPLENTRVINLPEMG